LWGCSTTVRRSRLPAASLYSESQESHDRRLTDQLHKVRTREAGFGSAWTPPALSGAWPPAAGYPCVIYWTTAPPRSQLLVLRPRPACPERAEGPVCAAARRSRGRPSGRVSCVASAESAKLSPWASAKRSNSSCDTSANSPNAPSSPDDARSIRLLMSAWSGGIRYLSLTAGAKWFTQKLSRTRQIYKP